MQHPPLQSISEIHFESNAEKIDPVDAAMKIEKFKYLAVKNKLTKTYAEHLSKTHLKFQGLYANQA